MFFRERKRLIKHLGGWRRPSVFHRYGIVDESMLRGALAKLSGRPKAT